MLYDAIAPLLPGVQKPARYTGGEVNMVKKNPEAVRVRFAFCFPDTYEVGMSHLGMKILYHILNKREDVLLRARLCALDGHGARRCAENQIPLYSLETFTPVRDFDLVGFTLQYEMSYTNVLNMLDLAGIPMTCERAGRGGRALCRLRRAVRVQPRAPCGRLWTCSWWATARSSIHGAVRRATTPGRRAGAHARGVPAEMAQHRGRLRARASTRRSTTRTGDTRRPSRPSGHRRARARAASACVPDLDHADYPGPASSCPTARSCTTASCWRSSAAARAAAASARRA